MYIVQFSMLDLETVVQQHMNPLDFYFDLLSGSC